MMRRFAKLAFAALLMVGATSGQAAWLKARSPHFTVYADLSEGDLRAMSTKLEKFDALLRLSFGIPEKAGQDLSPVTVYVVYDFGAVQRLYGNENSNVAGFYIPRASGSVAFTPRRGDAQGFHSMEPQNVLFHEYGHHFLLGNFSAAYPAWFSEGYAEFVSTVKFTDTEAQLGVPAYHRANDLFTGPEFSARDLFTIGARQLDPASLSMMYARGWLLTHYIMFTPGKIDAFQNYVRLLNNGTPSLEAATQAFGDLRALDRALDHHLRANTMAILPVPLGKLPEPEIAISALSPGENAMIALRMQSTRGVNDKTAMPTYQRGAKIAEDFPKDAVVQGWLAEMAYDAKQDDASEAAADRALAVDPKSIEALLYKARVHLRRAAEAHSTDPAKWVEARSWILRANAVDHDDPETLLAFYQSFGQAHAKPNAGAIGALERAYIRVPQDPSIRFLLANEEIKSGDVVAAKQTLRPLAYDPHAKPDNLAAKLIAILDSGKTGDAALAALADAEKADGAKN